MSRMRLRSGVAIAGAGLALIAGAAHANGDDVERLDLRPDVGRPKTTFTFWYRDHGPHGSPGDEFLIVIGPRGTRCRGPVIWESIAGDGRREPYRLGPNARYAPKRGGEGDDYFSRWCRGRYKVVIEVEADPDSEPITTARGRFRVR